MHRKLEDINDRNQNDKQMEGYSMFPGKKNQHCEKDYTIKCNLQIQCHPFQITNVIFHKTKTNKKKSHSSYGNTEDPE